MLCTSPKPSGDGILLVYYSFLKSTSFCTPLPQRIFNNHDFFCGGGGLLIGLHLTIKCTFSNTNS
jgi:hypothetical protein